MEHKIVFVKLITGEELITTHIDTRNENFTFAKTIQLMMVPPDGPNKKPSIAFLPFLPYTRASEKVEINRTSVQIICDLQPELVQEYQKATGSIITPNKSFILPK